MQVKSINLPEYVYKQKYVRASHVCMYVCMYWVCLQTLVSSSVTAHIPSLSPLYPYYYYYYAYISSLNKVWVLFGGYLGIRSTASMHISTQENLSAPATRRKVHIHTHAQYLKWEAQPPNFHYGMKSLLSRASYTTEAYTTVCIIAPDF